MINAAPRSLDITSIRTCIAAIAVVMTMSLNSLDILKLDYMLSGSNKTPSWSIIQSDESFYKKRFSLIDENPEIFDRFSHIPKKDIIKLVRFEEFAYNLKKSKKEYNIMVFFKDENPKMLN